MIKWREAWADVTNRMLAEKDIDERIDHRSFKERGITEQQNIREGVTAQIISRYKQKQAQKAVGECDEWLNWIKPEYHKYNDLKRETKSKKCCLRNLKSEQKATSKLNISKQVTLSKEIATLTEDMEELNPNFQVCFYIIRTRQNLKNYV